MSNNAFIQRRINEEQAKVDSYTERSATAFGDKLEELTQRISHHKAELSNYKQLQGELK